MAQDPIVDVAGIAIVGLDELESDLGLPSRFLVRLRDTGDDWSFVIKLCVVIEAALAQVICRKIDSKSSVDVIARMNLRGGSSKTALALSLDLIDKAAANCIERLADLRNHCAHNLASLGFDLAAYLTSLTQGEQRRFARAFLHAKNNDELDERSASFLMSYPRHAVWLGGYFVLLGIDASKRSVKIMEFQKTFNQHVAGLYFSEPVMNALKIPYDASKVTERSQ